MFRKNLLNLFLFILVCSLAAFIYLREEESFELARLTTIDIDDIYEIKIKHQDNTTDIIKQADNSWQIKQPILIAANSFRLKTILDLSNAPARNSYSLAEIDTRKLGLDETDTSIQFSSNNKNYRLIFGIINPSTNLRYVQLDDMVYTIEDVYYPLLSSHFGSLVSLNLLPANSKIEKLVLPELTLFKDDNDLWQSSNISDKVTADDIVTTIDNWQHTQAFGIHEYLQRKNLGEIQVYLHGRQQPIVYQITDTDPWLILARPELGLEYHLDIKAYDRLMKPR